MGKTIGFSFKPKHEECLFTKYTREVVDNLDSGTNEPPYRPYGYLLKKCTCKNCIEEKKINKRMELKK